MSEILEKTEKSNLQRTLSQRLVDIFFGYDFFISYAHADGKIYAEALALQLAQHGFECYLDTKESFKGDDWKEVGYWALKRTGQLVLVGTQKALESKPVLRELQIFSKLHKKIVPIDFSGSLSPEKNPNNEALQIVKSSVLQIREGIEMLEKAPSANAVEELEKSFHNVRQSVKRRRFLQTFTVLFLLLALLAFLEYLKSKKQEKEAYNQLAKVSWLIAELSRDQDQDPLKAAHYFLSAANLDERIGKLDEAKNAMLAAQMEGSKIQKSFVLGTPIQGVCSSPDGQFFLAWDDEGLGQEWNLKTGNLVGKCIKPAAGIHDSQFNNDGSRIYTFSSDGIVNLWNGTNASAIGGSITNSSSMGGADFSPDGKLLLTWDADKAARLWNAKDGSPFGKPLELGEDVWYSTFDLSGKHILTWSTMGKAQLWNVQNCEPAAAQIQVNAPLDAAMFTEDEKSIVTWSGDGIVQSWDLTNTTTSKILWKGNPFAHLLVGFERNWIWRFDMDGTAKLWKIPNSFDTRPKRNHIYISQSMIFSSTPPPPTTNFPSFDRARLKLWTSEDKTSLGNMLKTETDMDLVAFSPDGSRIVTLNRGKSVNLFDANSGQRVGQSLKHASTILGATFSKDSKHILTWSEDGTAKLWDAASGGGTGYLMNHQQTVNGGYFLKNGEMVLTWGADGVARIWNIDNQQDYNRTNYAPVNGAIFNKNGTRILLWGGGEAALWDGTNSIGQPMTHSGEVTGAMFSPDERYILTFSTDGTAKIWNAKDGSPLGQPIKHNASVVGAVFSPDSQRIVTFSADRRAQLSRTKDAKPIGGFIHPVLGVTFSRDSRTFVTHGQDYKNFDDQFAQIWSSIDGHAIGTHLLHDSTVVGATFTPNDQKILTWGMDSSARLWDSDGKPIAHPFILKPTDYKSNWLNEIQGVQFSPNGRQALFWNNLGIARSWNLITGEPITGIMTHRYVNKEGIVGATYSPDGSQILTWGADGIAHLWDARNGHPLGSPMTHATRIKKATFDSQQKRILTLSDDGVAKLWDSEGRSIGQPLRHNNAINGAIFNTDGSKILTWSDDGTARLWNASEGECICVFNHGDSVTSACFSPDEKHILTASKDGMARYWDISIDNTITIKKRILAFEVQSGTRLDTDGEIKTLNVEQWNNAKNMLTNTP